LGPWTEIDICGRQAILGKSEFDDDAFAFRSDVVVAPRLPVGRFIPREQFMADSLQFADEDTCLGTNVTGIEETVGE
jgi:hypothetical protein